MEMTALMQALVKDLAEQMKPLINEQIAVWAKDNLLPSLSNMEDNLGQKIQEHFNDNLADVAKHFTGGQLEHIARHVNLESLAAELAEVFTEDIAGNAVAEVEVRTTPGGSITSQRLVKSSGNKAWDDAVIKAIIRTETLPLDTDGRVPTPLIIEFRPKD